MTFRKLFVGSVLTALMAGVSFGEVANVSGRSKIRIDGNEKTLIEFAAVKKTDSQPAAGFFKWNADDNSRQVQVSLTYVEVDNQFAWLAGLCVSDTDGELVGKWLLLTVSDFGSPGRLVDHVWMQWLPDESIARQKIQDFERADKNQPIEDGDIVICS